MYHLHSEAASFRSWHFVWQPWRFPAFISLQEMASCSSARNAVSKQSICISNQVSVLWSSLLGWPRLRWISIMVWGSSCWLGLPRALFLVDVSEWYLSLKAFPAQVRFLLLMSCTWILSSLPKDYILFYRESVYSCIAPKLTSLPIMLKHHSLIGWEHCWVFKLSL